MGKGGKHLMEVLEVTQLIFCEEQYSIHEVLKMGGNNCKKKWPQIVLL